MTQAVQTTPRFITGRVAAILLAVAALSTIALLVLYAFAPDLRSDNSAGADAASRSAIGFAGLREILSLSGIPVRLDHGVQPGDTSAVPSLTILTPDMQTDLRDLALYQADGPLLIILPKWRVAPMDLHPMWVTKTAALGILPIQTLLRPKAGFLLKRDPLARTTITTAAERAAPPGMPQPAYPALDNVQTVTGGQPLLTAVAHGPLLSLFPGRPNPLYVLADPDLVNNHGLSDPATAQAAVAIIAALRRGSGPVVMDVTLNGLGRTPSFLRVLFEPTFLGATLCAFLAAALIGWHAAMRFGAPLAGGRVLALGPQALADSTASLIRMMGREGAMARRYVIVVREAALNRMGARRAPPTQQDSLLATLEGSGKLTVRYEQLTREAADASNGADLLRVARKAHLWKREITSGY